MSETLRIIKKEPNKEPEVIEIQSDLRSLQAQVDGPIEFTEFTSEINIISNEEYLLREDFEFNFRFILDSGHTIDYYGPVLFVKVDHEDGETISITAKEEDLILRKFNVTNVEDSFN